MTLLLLCGVLSVVADATPLVAPAIAVLAALAFAADQVTAVRRRPLLTGQVEAVLAGGLVALTGDATSPMLPYLLAPPLAIGLAAGRTEVLRVCAAMVGALVLGRAAVGGSAGSLADFVVASTQWVVLGLAFGIVAGWAKNLPLPPPSTDERYAEARELLEQLRGVTRRLPGGLDASSAAEALLDQCTEICSSVRSAVLVQPASDSSLVPAAVRGTTRVPWRTPLSEPGPLQRAWEGRVTVVDRRDADTDGRRAGSSVVIIPLLSGPEPLGLLILEVPGSQAFPPAVVAALEEAAEDASLRLETALLFEELRSTASVEERGRLAREMHDGVAQELAYVGYQLDALKAQAKGVDEDLALEIVTVRTGLTRLISDIRLSITDLRTSVSSDRGLGSAVSSYVRALGSGQGLAVHLSLQESAFRLPGETEVLLFRILQAVAQDVRKAGQANNLWVTLVVDPPSAHLCVEHDGVVEDLSGLDLSEYGGRLQRLGGRLVVAALPGAGVTVDAWLEGGGRDHTDPAGR